MGCCTSRNLKKKSRLKTIRRESEILSLAVNKKISLEHGKRYCTLVNNNPDGYGLIYDSESNATQVHWQNGKVNGEVIVVDIKKQILISVCTIVDDFIVAMADLSLVEWQVLDLTDMGDRWEGDTLEERPFGWGRYYDEENNLIYCGFRIGDNNVCYGTYYHKSTNKPITYYVGTICQNQRWGVGTSYDRLKNLVYQGEYINDTDKFKTVTIPAKSPALVGLHSIMEELVIGEESCFDVPQFSIQDCTFLKRIEIGPNCFAKKFIMDNDEDETVFSVCNLPLLEELVVHAGSFKYYQRFVIESVHMLKTITIGDEMVESSNFKYCSYFSVLGLQSLEKIFLGNYAFSHLERAVVGDLPRLQTIIIGEQCLCAEKNLKKTNVVGMLSPFRNSILILKDLPSLSELKTTGVENFNNFGSITIQNIPILNTLELRQCFVDVANLNVLNAESFKQFVGKSNGYGLLGV